MQANRLLVASALLVLTGCFAVGQAVASRTAEVTLTGIVLSADHRCARTHARDPFCRNSDWALASGGKTYLLFGDIPSLEKFARKRVNVSGLLEEEPVVSYGMRMIRRKITVRSIERSELSEEAIEGLMAQLKVVSWRGAENHSTPMHWNFAFTAAMIEVLQSGRGAQDILLNDMNDQSTRDQIVMLLGGVGDEKSIWPIIETLIDGSEATIGPQAKRLNMIANLALTNLTVSEVIWHHGGGVSIENCQDMPRSCWSEWWFDHQNSFKVDGGRDRLYTNYPNYGIYAQFEDTWEP